MPNSASANHTDPTLLCRYIGGPRDGMKTGDLPTFLSGQKLTGAVTRIPLAEPHWHSVFAVYVCTSEAQVDGFWLFEYRGMEGPNGELLQAAEQSLDRALVA